VGTFFQRFFQYIHPAFSGGPERQAEAHAISLGLESPVHIRAIYHLR
jgi:hypothetical protein